MEVGRLEFSRATKRAGSLLGGPIKARRAILSCANGRLTVECAGYGGLVGQVSIDHAGEPFEAALSVPYKPLAGVLAQWQLSTVSLVSCDSRLLLEAHKTRCTLPTQPQAMLSMRKACNLTRVSTAVGFLRCGCKGSWLCQRQAHNRAIERWEQAMDRSDHRQRTSLRVVSVFRPADQLQSACRSPQASNPTTRIG